MFVPVGLIRKLTQLKNCRIFLTAETVVQRYSVKKVFLKILQN